MSTPYPTQTTSSSSLLTVRSIQARTSWMLTKTKKKLNRDKTIQYSSTIPVRGKSWLERDKFHAHSIVTRSEHKVSRWPAVIQCSWAAYGSQRFLLGAGYTANYPRVCNRTWISTSCYRPGKVRREYSCGYESLQYGTDMLYGSVTDGLLYMLRTDRTYSLVQWFVLLLSHVCKKYFLHMLHTDWIYKPELWGRECIALFYLTQLSITLTTHS